LNAISVILPPIAYALFVLIFLGKRNFEGLLNALTKSHVIFFLFIVISTEILSAFRSIDFPHLVGAWSILVFICILATAITKRWRGIPSPLEISFRISWHSIFILGTIGFLLATTFATAIFYPPNNWDSMTYHMARVANWINNNSVTFYPTWIERQNYQMPLAEFAIMHLQVLSDSDLFANLVQWMCFFMSIELCALVALELGLDKTGQLVSSVFIATLPMAVLQSSNTQTDLVLTSFMLSFTLYMLRLQKCFNLENTLFASISMGLALLTKGTAYIFCGALGVSLALPILLKVKENVINLTKRMACFFLIVLLALAINCGHFIRTFQYYGTPVTGGGENYFNQTISATTLWSNTLRNIAIHCATPSIYLNIGIEKIFQSVLGKHANDPHTTWPKTTFGTQFNLHGDYGKNPTHFRIQFSTHEDYAGNPVHMVLILLAFASVFLWVRPTGQFNVGFYVAGVLLGGLFFCLFLKWQPWASRLHTPLFALSAPIIGIALTNNKKAMPRPVVLAVILSMVLYSLTFALENKTRPLLSQKWRKSSDYMELYFAGRPEMYESYRNAMDTLDKIKARDVGLYFTGDDYEYPLWVFSKEKNHQLRFRHVSVDDSTGIIRGNTSLPPYIISTKEIDSWLEGGEYTLLSGDNKLSVLKRIRNNE